jgi:hypothetical protein
LRFREVFEPLGQHVARFQVGHDEDVGAARHGRHEAFHAGAAPGDAAVVGDAGNEPALAAQVDESVRHMNLLTVSTDVRSLI